MELVEIIIYVLKLFSLSSFILLTLSYFFFKLKDRTRIKPYMLINTDPAAYEAPEEKKVVSEEEVSSESQPQQEAYFEQPKNKKYSRRFKVVNDIQKKQPVQEKMPEAIWQQSYQPQIRMVAQQIQPANIYNFYSSTTEPMHKLKLSAVAK